MGWPAEETWFDSKRDKSFFLKLPVPTKRLKLSPIEWLLGDSFPKGQSSRSVKLLIMKLRFFSSHMILGLVKVSF
jgi:hypothetical protein